MLKLDFNYFFQLEKNPMNFSNIPSTWPILKGYAALNQPNLDQNICSKNNGLTISQMGK